jgi:hypothetical protein
LPQAAIENTITAIMAASPIAGILDTWYLRYLNGVFILKLLCGVVTARGLFPPPVLSAQAENNKKM